jgi:hypothetical protein
MSRKAVDAVKEVVQEHEIKGYRVEYTQIPMGIIEKIGEKFRDKRPPKVLIAEKSTDDQPWYEENPNDPDYLQELEDNARRRGDAMIDTMVIMGVKLLDEVPKDEEWLDELRFNERIVGEPNLSEFDLADSLEREFVFKRFWLIGSSDMNAIGKATGVTEEGIEDAIGSFPGDEERGTDPDSGP